MGVTTTSPSIASSSTARTTLSDSSQEPKEFIYSQTTIDDSENQAPTDSPYMFSTSMAPSSSSDSPSSQNETAITEDLDDDSLTTLTDVRNVSETQDYGVHLVSATAALAVAETPSDKSEDSNGIEIGTIAPDVLISASPSTEPMFAIGKTEESIMEKIDHTTPGLTVEPTKSIEVSQTSMAKDDSILPNISSVHLTSVTEISPTEEIQSTVIDDYDGEKGETEIGVMAGPPLPQAITEDSTDGLSTMPVTTHAPGTFTTYTIQPGTTHSDVTESASSTAGIERPVSCTPEFIGDGLLKGEGTENNPSAEKGSKNCTDRPSVQVIIINIHQQNDTGKDHQIFCFFIIIIFLTYPLLP